MYIFAHLKMTLDFKLNEPKSGKDWEQKKIRQKNHFF